ncbi:hypothetical protein P3X46_025266 [Hevea brasiliensis]|uniref:Leucine-rich repeat-containing N-terminal plant-type domain-containing protein n=2 Tax=Hevea brasiliensis TaxID=3981 RepID=A0ABQ9L6T4_HEVBR|nr:hypothetical protein P3X46_025266 [Hevea brasiliensis]
METGNVIGLDLSASLFSGTTRSNNSLFFLRHLQKLDLSYNAFTLETAFFNMLGQNLTNLQALDLSQVDLSLVAPSSLMNLSSSLTSLELRTCSLQGKFPDISHLSELALLDLFGNNSLILDAMTFDKLVQNLSKLREVDLSYANMSFVQPSSLMNISSSLSNLLLSFCGLKGKLPNNIFQLPNLQSLNLAGNDGLTGSLPPHNWSNSLHSLHLSKTKIPIYLDNDFISNLKSLKSLGLSSCNYRVSNLELLGNLTQLTELDLSHNNFNGQIPSSLGNLKQLFSLDLSHNNFNGQIPFSLGNLEQLVSLDLSYNNFNGQIPSSFENLKQLHFLCFQNNKFSGQIPNYFVNFSQLHFLYLSNNQFTGPIPFQVGRLSSLFDLDLSNNLLNATIPPSLFTLPQLFTLILKNNQLTGHLGPFHDGSFVQIDLRNNKLNGPIPCSIFKLNSLQILDLSNNSLNGPIPQCSRNFSSALSVLHLGMNNLHGTIPEIFSVGSGLTYLNFNGNQLERRIPLSISNCQRLQILDLGNNNIDDTFPHFLETLPELQVLVLQSNKLHGLVKESFANFSFSKLRKFDLSNNMFSGPLPTEYFNNFKAMVNVDVTMKYMSAPNSSYDYSVRLTLKGLVIELVKIQTLLTTIDLSGNKFTGEIPQSIGKLKSLKLLNLSHNQLTGNIQSSLGNLSNLESLDLSSNLLVGRIPMQLNDLTFLEVFRVSHNRLEGPIPEGKQFNTFDASSYEGNLGLCGFPLKQCNSGNWQQPIASKEDDSESKIGFGWKPVLVGYACGVIFGVAMGYVVFKTRKPIWFVRMVEGEGHRKSKRFNN